MDTYRRSGGIAALVEAAAFGAGIVLLLGVLIPAGFAIDGTDPGQRVAFTMSNAWAVFGLDVIVYLVSGIAQVILALSLYMRLKATAPAASAAATAFGLIWSGVVIAAAMISSVSMSAVGDLYARDPALAASTSLAVGIIVDGLGGGTEFIGGLWVVMVCWTALRSGAFPKALSVLGLGLGTVGVLTVIPPFNPLGAVFGLGLIVWFTWLGMHLLRETHSQAKAKVTLAQEPDAATA